MDGYRVGDEVGSIVVEDGYSVGREVMTKVVGETDHTKFGENVGSCECDNARNVIVIIHTKIIVSKICARDC